MIRTLLLVGLTAALALAGSRLASAAEPAPAADKGPTTQPDGTPPLLRVVTYKTVGDVTLRMHVVGPAEGKDRPAVVLFFCGGWNGFDASKYFPQASYFASRGMVGFCAEVRVNARHKTTPTECVIDGRSAVRWVRSHAAEYGIDPNRIAAFGGSAAGHVSACAALLEELNDPADDPKVSARPNALLLTCPALDGEQSQKRIDHLGGPEKAKALSALAHVKAGAPPTLIMVGDSDQTTPLSESQAFQKAMVAAGSVCRIEVYRGAGHGFHNWFNGRGKHFPTTLRQMDAFLVSLDWLKGADTVDGFRYVKPQPANRPTTQPADSRP